MVLAQEFITLPPNECPYEVQHNSKFYPFFKDVLGAMDGTHIAAHISKSQVAAYRNRKGQVMQNVFAACTFSMYFYYVLSGWEGSAHDGRVFKDALTKGFTVPDGKYYLGDAGYALDDKCLTPYRGIRYHLREHYQSRKRYVIF
jgi:hypothetical protein